MKDPRIYTYKITFEEVPFYYYGAHKEKTFDEYYMGTPVTHKWCWDFYTPKKQILELFDYTDEGWLEAQEVEKRLIKPVYNADKWCLNMNCGGVIPIEILRMGGQKAYEEKLGFHGRTPEEMSEHGKIGGQKAYEEKLGFHGLTEEELSVYRKMGGQKAYEEKLGFHGRTPEEMGEYGKIGGQKTYEEKIGIHGLTEEELSVYRKMGGQKASSQKWQCTVTGHTSNPAALSRYQKARNIDTSNRIRVS